MNKKIYVMLMIFCLLICGCKSKTKSENKHSESNTKKEVETMEKQITLTTNNKTYEITLYDTPAANALYEMLPLDVEFEDFNSMEKIAYLKDTLPTENEPDGFQPSIGDFCLYAPWDNLSIFYKEFRYSQSLISLGHVNNGMDEIAKKNNNFVAKLERKEK